MNYFTCKYGHKHRTETAVEYCHVNVPWSEKEPLLQRTPWNPDGTKEIWCDLGRFRDLFWGVTRQHIILRDECCQYSGCMHSTDLEVHHIIPRRVGGTDHPANLIALCHEHHRIQPCHHHNRGLVLCGAVVPLVGASSEGRNTPRPANESTLFDFGFV